MKFASREIREKAVRAYIDGKASARQLADILGYTPASICNWVRDYRENQQLSARPNGHRKSCFSPEELEELKTLLDSNICLTLKRIREHFNKDCSLSAIHRMLVRLGYKYGKNARGQGTRARKCRKSQ